MQQRVRIELAFKDIEELRRRIKFLYSKGFRAFNIVNKNESDKLIDWVEIIQKETQGNVDICTHYSLKYNKKLYSTPQQHERRNDRHGGRGGSGDHSCDINASYAKFSFFLFSLSKKYHSGTHIGNRNSCSEFDDGMSSNNQVSGEVLVVSGSGKHKGKGSFDSVYALNRLKQERTCLIQSTMLPQICVAFNPFYTNHRARQFERDRLVRKLQSGRVGKVYLQFGSDLDALRSSLEWLSELDFTCDGRTLDLCGSIFLPTERLLSQQKSKPWYGVFLSKEFTKSPEQARMIVLDMMKLYLDYGVELLFEAPGIKNQKEVDLVKNLLNECDGTAMTMGPTDRDVDQRGQRKKSINRGRSQKSRDGARFEEDEEPPEEDEQIEINPIRVKATSQSLFSSLESIKPSTSVPSRLLSKPCILLFGSFDVRLHDNRAVEFASFHSSIIPVFLWSRKEEGKWGVRGALEVILKDALRNLNLRLNENNNLRLICRDTANTITELLSICWETGAQVVYYNKELTTEGRLRDARRKKVLEDQNGIICVPSQSALLYDTQDMTIETGSFMGHWGTLIPFLRNCRKQYGEPPRPPSSSLTSYLLSEMKGPSIWPSSVEVKDLSLAIITGCERWDQPILDRFPMSEEEAEKLLNEFILGTGLKNYEFQRSRADIETSTSRLSAHLKIGTLSPFELYWRTELSPLTKDQKNVFSRRLFWRDLAYYQLAMFPLMRDHGIRVHYDTTDWVTGEEAKRRLVAWKKGQTGYPIVDAAMRELWATGWMTQTVRMIAASFLVEFLRVNWVAGCDWFHYTLVDADSAINAMMWQNAGRSGADQWNFILSPETASQDPTGRYTRKWVPELAGLPNSSLHRPWTASKRELEEAGIVLGKTYPHRIIVDLHGERRKSFDSVLKMRRRFSDMYVDGDGYDVIVLPDGGTTRLFTRREFRIGHLLKPIGR